MSLHFYYYSYPLIESTISSFLSLLLLLFTYILPLLSSIRTIHNHDVQSYKQWLTYWLLIYLSSPILSYINSYYKTFTLSFILWLSLPRFQGASIIYTEIIHVYLVDKYQVDTKVDGKIGRFKIRIKDAFWNIAQDVGWGVLYQIGGVVSYIQDYASNLVDVVQEQQQLQQQQQEEVVVEEVAMNITSVREKKYDKDCKNNNQEETSIITPSQLPSSASSRRNHHIVPAISSSKLNTTTNPVHSVQESFSSLSTSNNNTPNIINNNGTQSNTNTSKSSSLSPKPSPSSSNTHHHLHYFTSVSEKQTYINDFISILQKGLYVFAWYNESQYITITDCSGHIIQQRKQELENSSKACDRFRLRVFSFYQEDGEEISKEEENDCNNNTMATTISTTSRPNNNNDYQNGYFVLNSVQSRPDEEGMDIISFPLDVVTEVKESSRGIQFLSTKKKEPVVQSDNDNGISSATTISPTNPMKSKSLSPSSRRNNNKILLAEIVLSDEKDRNILLFGLRTLLFDT